MLRSWGPLCDFSDGSIDLYFGRDKPGGDAICFVSVDQPVSDELLRRIEEIPQVKRARAVRF